MQEEQRRGEDDQERKRMREREQGIGAALSPRQRVATVAGITSPGSTEGALPGSYLRKMVTWRSWAGPRWGSARREREERWAGFRSRRGKKNKQLFPISIFVFRALLHCLNCM
jgi:hypothetical protein